MRTLALLLLAAVSVFGADVTGTWSFTVQTDAGAGNPTFVFKQDGERLTGKYTGLLGSADVTGTVKGDKIDFEFEGSYDGNKLKVKYTGTIQSPKSMKGTAGFADLGSATWTAEKK